MTPGQWNDCEIAVKQSAGGDVYTVSVNGQVTTTYTNTDAFRGRSNAVDPASGFIGLQANIGLIAFRNIRIQAGCGACRDLRRVLPRPGETVDGRRHVVERLERDQDLHHAEQALTAG